MIGRGSRSGAAVALVGALVLSGCAAQDRQAPYATATAADLQQTVLHVTKAADDGEFAAARTRLHELEVATKVAHARGELTEARHDSILAAIALVRADLEALIAEAEAAAAEKKKAEEEARKAAEAKAAEEARQAAEAKAAAEAEAAAQAEREAEQAAQERNDRAGHRDDGKGKGKGKGKGNDKDRKNKGEGKGKGKD
jgi:hypothetical protein